MHSKKCTIRMVTQITDDCLISQTISSTGRI